MALFDSRDIAMVAFLLVFWCWKTEAIWMSIPPDSGIKCVSEDIQRNVVVLGDYYVITDDDPAHMPNVSVRVSNPHGKDVYHKENVTVGQFAFTTSEAGVYVACFWLDNHLKQQQAAGSTMLSLDWRIGISAKDWDSVAKKEKIEGVDLDLRKLEESVGDIHNNLIYLKLREEQMREVSETTNARVAWYSMMSITICIVVSIFQLWHLKGFFQKKMLI